MIDFNQTKQGVNMKNYIGCWWIIMIVPAGLLSALVLGVWTHIIGGDIINSTLGAFLGTAVSFIIIHFIYKHLN
jgi:hypothetical protein